jgi:acyl carrier protein
MVESRMIEDIRAILQEHTRLQVEVDSLTDEADLYAAGLSSFATVHLMLALEEKFDVEFPDRLLNRKSFESVAAIRAALTELTAGATAG